MKVSISWLKELVDIKLSVDNLVRLLPLRTIGVKESAPHYIELDMKGYNRADLLSLRGVSLEIAAITDSEVKFIEENSEEKIKKLKFPSLDVKVEDEKLAPVYCLVKIQNLKVEKSKDSWVQKLSESGYRSINNLADITNLVMLEYGQPLHAFDADTIKDEKIIVRAALPDEKITTLDGKTRNLNPFDLLITDPSKPVGIAGVMGGKNSEVTESTTTIFLEAAIFDPKALRKTATRLGLQSEASKRFYHGLTKRSLFQALKKAIDMYKNLGGAVTGISITDNFEDKKPVIELNLERINSLIGIALTPEQITTYLNELYFAVKELSPTSWLVTPPYFRLDIEREEDVIEEIARMYGYEKIPAIPLSGDNLKKIDQSLFDIIYNLKTKLVELGATEVQTYPYFSTAVLDALGLGSLENLVKVANPISKENEYLRTHLWPNLLESSSRNLKYFDDVFIFEVGKTYTPQKNSTPKERYVLSVCLVNGSENPVSELNAFFEQLDKTLKMDIKPNPADYSNTNPALFHPNRVMFLAKDGKQAGILAEVHKRVSDKLGMNKRAAVIELQLHQ